VHVGSRAMLDADLCQPERRFRVVIEVTCVLRNRDCDARREDSNYMHHSADFS